MFRYLNICNLFKYMYSKLQITALSFFFPFILSIYMNKWGGMIIYFLNMVVSIYVHRLKREKKHNWVDKLDRILISLWVLYNCYNYNLSIQNESLNIEDLIEYSKYYRKLSRILVVSVLLSRILSLQFPWRSQERNNIHGIMHISGALGSCLLIKSIN